MDSVSERLAILILVGVKLKKQRLQDMYTMRDVLCCESGASSIVNNQRICRHLLPLLSITKLISCKNLCPLDIRRRDTIENRMHASLVAA